MNVCDGMYTVHRNSVIKSKSRKTLITKVVTQHIKMEAIRKELIATSVIEVTVKRFICLKARTNYKRVMK